MQRLEDLLVGGTKPPYVEKVITEPLGFTGSYTPTVWDEPVQREIGPNEATIEEAIEEERIARENLLSEIMQGDESAGLYQPPEIPDYLLNDPEIVGYPDKEMQEEIYRWAAEDVIPIIGEIAIVDIGAGRGDLDKFIGVHYPELKYSYDGYESNPVLCAAATKLKNRVYNKTFASTYDELNDLGDWAFCIGSLNQAYDFEEHPLSRFERILQHSINWIKNGIVFILLSDSDDSEYIAFPINSIVHILKEKFPNIPYKIDCSKFNGIYKLTIFNSKFPD